MGTERALDIWQSLLPYSYPLRGKDDCATYAAPFSSGSCLMTINAYQVGGACMNGGA